MAGQPPPLAEGGYSAIHKFVKAGLRSCPICEARAPAWKAPYPVEPGSPFSPLQTFFCSHCGSGFADQADAVLDGYYRDTYAVSIKPDRGLSPEQFFGANALEERPQLRRYFERAAAQVEALRARGASFGRVLDYGSGPGYLLFRSEARERYAVELDSSCWKHLDHVGATRVQEDALPEGFFDVIVASHCIEHLTATTLRPSLRRLLQALAPGGLMLIEVPQGAHSYLKLDYKQEPHTLFFSPQGLVAAVERAGGTVVDAYSRGGRKARRRPRAFYRPPAEPAFLGTASGGLTVICRR